MTPRYKEEIINNIMLNYTKKDEAYNFRNLSPIAQSRTTSYQTHMKRPLELYQLMNGKLEFTSLIHKLIKCKSYDSKLTCTILFPFQYNEPYIYTITRKLDIVRTSYIKNSRRTEQVKETQILKINNLELQNEILRQSSEFIQFYEEVRKTKIHKIVLFFIEGVDAIYFYGVDEVICTLNDQKKSPDQKIKQCFISSSINYSKKNPLRRRFLRFLYS